jgi:hypothetical protein
MPLAVMDSEPGALRLIDTSNSVVTVAQGHRDRPWEFYYCLSRTPGPRGISRTANTPPAASAGLGVQVQVLVIKSDDDMYIQFDIEKLEETRTPVISRRWRITWANCAGACVSESY